MNLLIDKEKGINIVSQEDFDSPRLDSVHIFI